MITLRPLGEARVLIVGAGDLINEILQNLTAHGRYDLLQFDDRINNAANAGVSNITVIDATTASNEKLCHFVKEDPEAYIKRDSSYFKSFDVVLAANQPRSFELALSELRWPKNETESDLPMMVMRSVANNCKMRCQYCELPVEGSISSKFISLPMDLLPWTDEKRQLVASTVEDRFHPKQDQTFQSYLIAARAVVDFQQSKGAWPGTQDQEQLLALTGNSTQGSKSEIQEFIQKFSEKGLAAADETIKIMGQLVASDAIKLLSGNGKPINNTNLEEVIKIVTDSM